MAEEKIIDGSCNVFADLGVAEPEAHKLKAGLVGKLAEVIASRGLSQSAAAKLTGLSQPDLSRLLSGRFRDVGPERLLRALTRLDSEIEITVRRQGRQVGDSIHLHARGA